VRGATKVRSAYPLVDYACAFISIGYRQRHQTAGSGCVSCS
jgi:hypothetical protein